MERLHRRWIYPQSDTERIAALFPRFTLVEGTILENLGFPDQAQAIAFLTGESEITGDPFRLLGMDQAVDRVERAIASREAVTIYADYDADGVTAAALLFNGLRALGAIVEVYFPDRFTEGYGLNPDAVERIAKSGCSLMISVDCGIRAIEESRFARQLGMDLIITDHHHPPPHLPEATTILNPNREGDAYPHKELAGVGVAYKLLQALTGDASAALADESLDLVAIGTVADMSRLVGENRTLVRRGLELLNSSPRPGLQSLIDVAGYQSGRIDATAIGFGIGPRINAAGRLERANIAFDLLTMPSQTEACLALARRLDEINRRRQDLTHAVVDQVESEMGAAGRTALFAFDAAFHEGVVGLAASRLSEVYYRPAIVGKMGVETTRASARSIPGLHLARVLEECADLLVRYGGHAAAAGLSLENQQLDAFMRRFEDLTSERLDDELLTPKLNISADVSIGDLDMRLLKFHDRLQPMGEGNAWPILAARNVKIVDRRRVGAEGRHLKLRVRDESQVIDAIAFQMGELHATLPERVDVAFRLERNEYRGLVTPQMVVVDVKPGAA